VTAIQRVRPKFVATNLITGEDRTPRVVLEANRDHNSGRIARLERVVFRNDLSPQEALDAVCDHEGEIDIVSEVAASDARRVQDSEHARLVTIDANRMLTGVFNTYESNDAPLQDVRMREALNWAVDRHRIAEEAFSGYATPLAALTPPWCNGSDAELEPRRRDPARAKGLADAAAWPAARRLRIAADGSLEAIAAMIAADVHDALGIDSEIIVVAPEQGIPTARALVEKKLTPFWDVLLNPWFDLSSDNPIAFVHREFFGHDGGFRAGPPDPEFDRMFAELARTVDPDRSRILAQQIDRYVYDQSKALFLCAPNALYAVNRHVDFKAYRATFELADTQVSPQHWSRREH
jgi:ABC-type transport system substrate-binding protein